MSFPLAVQPIASLDLDQPGPSLMQPLPQRQRHPAALCLPFSFPPSLAGYHKPSHPLLNNAAWLKRERNSKAAGSFKIKNKGFRREFTESWDGKAFGFLIHQPPCESDGPLFSFLILYVFSLLSYLFLKPSVIKSLIFFPLVKHLCVPLLPCHPCVCFLHASLPPIP